MKIKFIIFIVPVILLIILLPKILRENRKDDVRNSESMQIYIKINNETLTATLVSNSSTDELIKKLEDGEITVNLSDYGNFEKVGDLGFDLPTNDSKITTEPGDIILYLGNQITIYYDINTWEFTRLGKIDNIDQESLKRILGDGDVIVKIGIMR